VKRFAAITVGAENLSMVAFTIDPEREVSRDSVLFALSSIRHSINLKLAKEKLESIILQSREIQLSLLPDEDVSFPGYDIYGRSQPAELVGGDVYDFIQISPKIFGIAIGDATGHGLPAALQARDVVIGLRMGISEDQKMVKVLERLNKVIHGSRLTSRFVSLWYGELEPSGHLIYSNAGHVPPFYYRKKKDRFYPMSEGGMVLGPSSESVYRRGFFKIEPGDAVILYTDGITEAANKAGEQFGEERLLEFVRGHLGTLTAQQMVDGLMDAVAEFSSRGPYQDDRTVVFLRRLD
jgi:sigma-B regulation protein RsbU (phosphoserine phosphatase)